jgi:CHASE3 domain sensor protein
MKWSFAAKLTLSFLCSAAAFAVAAFFCWERAKIITVEAQSESTSQTVLTLSDELLEQLRQSEAGQQGFIITNDTLYLESYSQSVGQIGLTMKSLYAVPNRSANLNASLGKLDSLLAKKFNEFNVSLQLKREKKYIQPAANVIVKSKGRINTDSIRATIIAIQTEQRDQMRERQQQIVNNSADVLVAALGAGCGALMLLFVLSLWSSWCVVRSLKRIAASVEKFALGDLFHRISEVFAPETNGVVVGLNAMAVSLQERTQSSQGARNVALEAMNASSQGIMALRTLRTARGEIADFEITLANPAAASLLGLAPNAAQGMALTTLPVVSNANNDALLEQCKQVIETAQNLTMRHLLIAGGSTHTVNVAASKYGDGVVLALMEEVDEIR